MNILVIMKRTFGTEEKLFLMTVKSMTVVRSTSLIHMMKIIDLDDLELEKKRYMQKPIRNKLY
ncbi:hypothetical protein [Peribacillus simplex]|uniref:hypothetical protein n=1 Tax=Peribacillus simplex TaxID=1478 RepID=UPI0007775AF1|nr:hypothetical protein UP17_25775 [Peribacillus simplex]